MNRVEFAIVPDEEPHLEINVDGVPLRELARRAELPSARADRQEDLAGAYHGLTGIEAVRWPSRHFLGRPALAGEGPGETALLGCDCGVWDCWPLFAKVEVSDETVTWRDFRNGHRPAWDLSGLGPFEFERGRYEAALRATAESLSVSRWTGPLGFGAACPERPTMGCRHAGAGLAASAERSAADRWKIARRANQTRMQMPAGRRNSSGSAFPTKE